MVRVRVGRKFSTIRGFFDGRKYTTRKETRTFSINNASPDAEDQTRSLLRVYMCFPKGTKTHNFDRALILPDYAQNQVDIQLYPLGDIIPPKCNSPDAWVHIQTVCTTCRAKYSLCRQPTPLLRYVQYTFTA